MTGGDGAAPAIDKKRLTIVVVGACVALAVVETAAALDLYTFLEAPHPFVTGARRVPEPTNPDEWVLDPVEDWSAAQRQQATTPCGIASVVAERFPAWEDVTRDCQHRELRRGALILEEEGGRSLMADPAVGIVMFGSGP